MCAPQMYILSSWTLSLGVSTLVTMLQRQMLGGWEWWHTPEIPALRVEQGDLEVPGQPWLHMEWKTSVLQKSCHKRQAARTSALHSAKPWL